jgi:hypothetical protein
MATGRDGAMGRRTGFLLGALALLGVTTAAEAAHPDFNGKWRLNTQRSENPRAKVEDATGPASVQGAGGNGGRERWLPRGESGEVDRVRFREQMLALADQLDSLEIKQTATEINVAHGDTSRIFYFDREHVRETESGEKVKARTSWKGEQLVVDEQGKGLRIIEIYTLLPGGKQVIQNLRYESSMFPKPVELKLVYDRAD